MTTRSSFEKFRRWSTRHYGLIAIFFAFLGFIGAGYQTIRLQNQAVILDYKMQVIEQKLDQYQEIERERIAYDSSVSKDLKEIKGYVQGVSDKTMRQMINQLPVDYKKKGE